MMVVYHFGVARITISDDYLIAIKSIFIYLDRVRYIFVQHTNDSNAPVQCDQKKTKTPTNSKKKLFCHCCGALSVCARVCMCARYVSRFSLSNQQLHTCSIYLPVRFYSAQVIISHYAYRLFGDNKIGNRSVAHGHILKIQP